MYIVIIEPKSDNSISYEQPASYRHYMEQTKILYKNMPYELCLGGLSALAATALFWGRLNHTQLFLWLSVAFLSYAARFVLGKLFKEFFSEKKANRWFALMVGGILLAGIIWGMMGVIASSQASVSRIGFTLFWICCLSLASIAIYSCHFTAVLAFSAPALSLPLLYLLYQGSEISYTLAVMLIVFQLILLASTKGMQKVFLPLWSMQKEHSHLLEELEENHNQLDKLNVALKTSNDKTLKTEYSLQETTENFHQVKSKVKTLTNILDRAALNCPVTGLPNRRHLNDLLNAEWKRLRRTKKPLSLIMFDLDNAEENRDFYRSQPGQECLKYIANILRKFARRGGDMAARYWNTRFVLLLVEANSNNALRIAESLRKRIEKEQITYTGLDKRQIITIHVGAATMLPNRDTTFKTLIERADAALYESKFHGGNKVMSYRSLDKIRLEHWNRKIEGSLTEDGLLQKLRAWGFGASKIAYPPNVVVPDKFPETETIWALLTGQIHVMLEGQSIMLRPGDCLFLPPGSICSTVIKSKVPVLIYEAIPLS